MRFPLRDVTDVRAAWPAERPLAVRLVADDRQAGGLPPGDAVFVARALKRAGVDLILVTAGGSVGTDGPAGEYRRLYQVALADRIRNEAAMPVVAAGRITTLDEIDTIVSAGRADLCVLDPRLYVDATPRA